MPTTSPRYGLHAPELADAPNIEDAVVPLRDDTEDALGVVDDRLIAVEGRWAGAGATGAFTTPGDVHANGGNLDLNGPTISKGGGGELSYRTGGGTPGHIFRAAGVSGTADGAVFAGDVTAVIHDLSDARLKSEVAPLADALELVAQLRGVSFKWESGASGVGVIAQEVEAVLPDAIAETPTDEEGGERGTLSVSVLALVGVLIESVKELSERVAVLETSGG